MSNGYHPVVYAIISKHQNYSKTKPTTSRYYYNINALTCTRYYRRTRRRCGPRRLRLPPSSAAVAAAAAKQRDSAAVAAAVPGRCCKRARPLVPSRPQCIITDGPRNRRTSVTRGDDIIIASKQRGGKRDRLTSLARWRR